MLRFLLGIASSLLFLALLLWQFDLAGVPGQLSRVDGAWLLAGVLTVSVEFSLRIARWRLLLGNCNAELRWRNVAGPLLGSYSLSNLLPFRLGELARVFLFTEELGISSGRVASTVIVERLLDMLCVVLILLACIPLVILDAQLAWVEDALVILLGLLSVGLLAILLTARWWRRWLEGTRFAGTAAGNFALHLLEGLGEIRGLRLWAPLLVQSALIWVLQGLVFLCACHAIGAMYDLAAPWLAMGLAAIGTTLPSAPGYIGTFHYFATLAFSSSGMDDTAASSAAILSHLFLWLPVTLAGGSWLLRHWGKALLGRLRALRREGSRQAPGRDVAR